ncbi:MAG: hypothetical protein H6817_03465 [Phycisphaerales bacterium]|nr:hypothetical protein [Phycisphaerales bacterium]
MAVARAQGQGGITAIHIWLIVFVALWLTSTVLLVILYLDQEKLAKDDTAIKDEIAKVIGSADKQLPEWTSARPGSGSTMVALIEAQRADTAELASGARDNRIAALRESFDAATSAMQADRFIQQSGTPLVTTSYADALDDVYRRFRAASEALEQAEQGSKDMAAETERLRGMQAGQKDEYAAQAEALRAEVEKLRGEYEASQQEHEDKVASFEKQIEDIQQNCTDDIQAQRTLTAEVRDEYDDLYARFEQLKAKLGQSQVSPIRLATARIGDGEIVTAKPGDKVVYINLGKRDHLTLGLEFAVYDALAGIPEDGRAKARIEVVSIADQSAECRIIEKMTNDLVMAGDIIANPIYDRTRTLKFFVMGEFDMNGDGKDDSDGPERIETIIEKWGGEIEQRLTARVDFVVLGGPPPTPKRSLEYDESDDRQYLAQKQIHDRYEQLKANVRSLAVPVLTQSVFMNFLGQTGTQLSEVADMAATP